MAHPAVFPEEFKTVYVEVMEEEWLLSEEQVRSLLKSIHEQPDATRSVHPFMRTVAEHALFPFEARALRVSDVALLEGNGGELTVRRKGKEREMPLQSQFVEFLREWIRDVGLKEDDLLFPGMRGGAISESDYKQVWEQAQEAILPRDELFFWRLGEPISILRDSCLVKWLRAGIPPVTVAELAGTTPRWLALRYPHCLRAGDAGIDGDHLAEGMALADSPKS